MVPVAPEDACPTGPLTCPREELRLWACGGLCLTPQGASPRSHRPVPAPPSSLRVTLRCSCVPVSHTSTPGCPVGCGPSHLAHGTQSLPSPSRWASGCPSCDGFCSGEREKERERTRTGQRSGRAVAGSLRELLSSLPQRGLARQCRDRTGQCVRGPEWPLSRLGWQPLQPSCPSR